MAVDGPGVRKVLEAAAEAKKKNLSLMSGFCWRRHPIMRDTMKRVHDGDLGDILTMQSNYNTGPIWVRPREKGMTDMEHQMRNWYYYAWLSGDFNVEQHIHSLDKAAWAMKDVYPVRAVGLGGRQVRTGPEFGHIFDHHAVVYEYENGTRLFSFCRQQAGCAPDTSDHFWGTQGTCHVVASFPPRVKISGKAAWTSHAERNSPELDMYQIEHNELFASIRNGKPINDGEWMARSTLMGIMGRLATYTGQVITWENCAALAGPVAEGVRHEGVAGGAEGRAAGGDEVGVGGPKAQGLQSLGFAVTMRRLGRSFSVCTRTLAPERTIQSCWRR